MIGGVSMSCMILVVLSGFTDGRCAEYEWLGVDCRG